MDKVVHFEIPVDDEARAKDFYASAFGWNLNTMDMGGGNSYTTATTVTTVPPRKWATVGLGALTVGAAVGTVRRRCRGTARP